MHSMARDSIALLCLALHRPIAFQSSQQGRSTKAQRANCFERFSSMHCGDDYYDDHDDIVITGFHFYYIL